LQSLYENFGEWGIAATASPDDNAFTPRYNRFPMQQGLAAYDERRCNDICAEGSPA